MSKINFIKNYILFIILSIIIVILFGIVSYDNLNSFRNSSLLVGNNVSTKISNLKNVNGKKYIQMQDYNNVLKDNIYLDKISRKLIYTTLNDGVYKEKIDNNLNIIYEDSNIWINVEHIAEIFNNNLYDIPQTKTIKLTDEQGIEGTILKNNVDIYYAKQKNSVHNIKISNNTKVEVVKENLENNWVAVIYTQGTVKYLGYVLKNNIQYDEKENVVSNNENNMVSLLVSEENKYTYLDGINTVAVDGLTITSVNGNIREENRKKILNNIKKQNINIMRIIDNGYSAVNTDNSVISLMLQSETNREKCINKIVAYCTKNKIYGIVIDFKGLKVENKDVYTQYLKELKSNLTKTGFKLYVKSNLQNYIDTENILRLADGVILELYNERSLSAATSGTHSNINDITRCIKDYAKKGLAQNIILEVPMFNILWTERNGIIMNSEIYSAKLTDEYITKNKIKTVLNKNVNQRYFEVIKGSITYKMWLEDEYTLKNKLKLVKDNKLLGISIYKSGYESNKIREVIENEL